MPDRSAITVPDLFAPAWAGGWGEDEYGVYAELRLGEIALEPRWIPPGRFFMGSPQSEVGRFPDEGPQHLVTLTRGFWLASTPCTQEPWQALMGENPSGFKGERRPVEKVDWNQATDSCRKLTDLAHRPAELPVEFQFRLPTEAEWEYACRAGTTKAFNMEISLINRDLCWRPPMAQRTQKETVSIAALASTGWVGQAQPGLLLRAFPSASSAPSVADSGQPIEMQFNCRSRNTVFAR